MNSLFLLVLNMSLTASYVIVFVMIVRLLLKKSPKIISYGLWTVVGFRLAVPFSFESVFSLIPWNLRSESISKDLIYSQVINIKGITSFADSFSKKIITTPNITASVDPWQIYTEIGAYIWVLGIVLLLSYSVISIFQLKKHLKNASLIDDNIFEAVNLKTPFVIGILKPKIYLPSGISLEEQEHILLHEKTHIKRKDHIIKAFAFIIFSIHWFNPFVWLAFMMMSADMELSCDESVLKEMNLETKKSYANSLLSLATERHILSGSPIAFGEGNVSGRIKNILTYKKPKFKILSLTIILVIVIGVGLLANPINTKSETMDTDYSKILWQSKTKYIGDNSAVGNLIGLLNVPEGVSYNHFKLYTSNRPYNIEIVYSVSSELLKQYEKKESLNTKLFSKNAVILLTLVDNADGVRTILTDGNREVGFINTREDAEKLLDTDIRSYAESPEKIKLLTDMPTEKFSI